jgi:hypothetical protein
LKRYLHILQGITLLSQIIHFHQNRCQNNIDFFILTFIAFDTPVNLDSTNNIACATTSTNGSPDDYASLWTQLRSPI